MQSYTEISPSGRGVHIIVKGRLPGAACKREHIEIYDENRYFTVTGNLVDGSPRGIENRNEELQPLYRSVCDQSEVPPEDAIIEKAVNARNGAKFKSLWDGDWSDYPSPSEADLALCQILAYWSGNDTGMIDRLFRRSGLYRAKWDESHYGGGKTYGQATIEKIATPPEKNGRAGVADPVEMKKFNLTDMGNAERLLHHIGSDIRYCHAWKSWLIWDGERWGA